MFQLKYLPNALYFIQIEDIWSGIGDKNQTKDIAESLKEAISSEMEDSSNKRMKAGNLNASLEAIQSLVGAHELYHDIPYNHEVQVDTRTLKFSKWAKTYNYNIYTFYIVLIRASDNDLM